MGKEYKKFYETDLWKEGYKLQKEVFDLTKSFPSEEKYGLGSQLTRSSNSVIANLAEEHGRYHFADKIRVLYIVRAELQETQSHLIVAAGRTYVSKEKVSAMIKKYENLKIKINGRIGFFSKKKKK